MKNIAISLSIAALSFFLGFTVKTQLTPVLPICPPQKPCPAQKPCPVCDFNITGSVKSVTTGFLEAKNRIQINFNGIEALSGYLSSTNNAQLIGAYKGIEATAVCSGAEVIVCKISYDKQTHTLSLK